MQTDHSYRHYIFLKENDKLTVLVGNTTDIFRLSFHMKRHGIYGPTIGIKRLDHGQELIKLNGLRHQRMGLFVN